MEFCMEKNGVLYGEMENNKWRRNAEKWRNWRKWSFFELPTMQINFFLNLRLKLKKVLIYANL
jgi:hypothetical protein